MNVAINGFGRIGRQVFKILSEKYPDEVKVVAVNDLTDVGTLSHLLKYDSNYGTWVANIISGEEHISVNGKKTKVFSEKIPSESKAGLRPLDPFRPLPYFLAT